jgi:hypothetical protein
MVEDGGLRGKLGAWIPADLELTRSQAGVVLSFSHHFDKVFDGPLRGRWEYAGRSAAPPLARPGVERRPGRLQPNRHR